MFLTKYDNIGREIQSGYIFNPTYMFHPLARYLITNARSTFAIYAVFGFRIGISQIN